MRSDRAPVHRHADGLRLHRSAALIFSAVTGSASKRLPVASAMALRMAGATGIITSSAIPFGTSVGPSGGSTSIFELPDRKVGGARHPIAIEVPGAVAGPVLVERQIFVAARSRRPWRSRLPPGRRPVRGTSGAPAFEHGHGIDDGHRAGRLVDLDRDDAAARRRVADADPLDRASAETSPRRDRSADSRASSSAPCGPAMRHRRI